MTAAAAVPNLGGMVHEKGSGTDFAAAVLNVGRCHGC